MNGTVHAVLLYGLKFAKPRGNASENVRQVAMRTSQLRTIARKTCETLGVKLEPSINVVPCYGTHEFKHGHDSNGVSCLGVSADDEETPGGFGWMMMGGVCCSRLHRRRPRNRPDQLRYFKTRLARMSCSSAVRALFERVGTRAISGIFLGSIVIAHLLSGVR